MLLNDDGPLQKARRLYSGVAADRTAATALPRAAFLDADVYAAEVEHVLKAGWLPVARTSDVANSGDYRCVDLLGVPLVVTRDTAGALHVLSRVCRHRGMPVLEGSGNCGEISCPYHLWRYGLDGRLLFAPAMDRSPQFDALRSALLPIAHEEWLGWVFANLSGSAVPLAPQLTGLTCRLAQIRPERFVTVDVLEFESPWNWKVMVENFMESYHHIGPHAQTLQRRYPGFGTYATDDAGLFAILENPPVDASADPLLVACVFPLTLMAFVEGASASGVWYEFDRLERDRFLLRIHLLLPPEEAAVPELVTQFRDAARAIHLEDIVVCEGAQRGYRSTLYQGGPLSHLEGGLWHFHRYLARCMG